MMTNNVRGWALALALTALAATGCGGGERPPNDAGMPDMAGDAACSDCGSDPCVGAGCEPRQVCSGPAGALDCQGASCEPGYTWNANRCDAVGGATCGGAGGIAGACAGLFRTCGATAVGAACGECLPGYDRVSTQCAPSAQCQSAMCTQSFRACGSGSTCGACLSGFSDVAGACQPQSCGSCTALGRECDAGACGACLGGAAQNPDGTCPGVGATCAALDCAAQHRTCTETPVAACDDACVDGYVWENDACRARLTCADIQCSGDDTCFEGSPTTDASCRTTCGPGTGLYPNGDGTDRCVACGSATVTSCGVSGAPGDGETGFLISQTGVANGGCFCETQDGYFPGTLGRAVDCDEDGDGWTNDEAYDQLVRTDSLTYPENTRCDVRFVTGFLLVPDIATDPGVLEVVSLAGGGAVPLYEIAANDRPTEIMRPSYPTGGAPVAIPGNVVNSLTKACISHNSDLNGNGEEDVREAQLDVDTSGLGLLAPAFDVYARYSYYIELHDGWFQPSMSDPLEGTYVIRERPRDASGNRPIGLVRADGSEFWRECDRKDDYLSSQTAVGADFSCATSTGVCERRMFHHSSFRCVLGASSSTYSSSGATAGSQPSLVYQFPGTPALSSIAWWNETRPGSAASAQIVGVANSCAPGAATPLGNVAANPSGWSFSCSVADVDTSAVRAQWVVVDYANVGVSDANYVRGCVNECATYGVTHCPTYVAGGSPAGFVCDMAAGSDFGRIECGCGVNYSGLSTSCGMGCPTEHVFSSDGFSPLSRVSDGMWMCIESAASDGAVLPGSAAYPVVRTGVPNGSTDGAPLTSQVGVGTYRLSGRAQFQVVPVQ